MVRFRYVALLLTLSLTAGPLACSDDDSDNNGNGTDTGQPDTGADAGDVTSDVPDIPPTGESLVISMVTHTRADDPEVWQMLVTDEDCDTWPERCDTVEVTGGGFTCESECAITPNRDYAIWMDPTTPGTLMIGDIDGDFAVTSIARTLAQGVETWQLGPEKVVFSRTGAVFAQDFSGGNAVELISLSPSGLPGGFTYAPQIDRVIVTLPVSLSAMDLREVSVSDPTNQRLLAHLYSDVEETTGSFYQGQMDVSVSPDGKLVAFVTRALDTTNPCDPAAAASSCDVEYTCSGNSNRCIGEMLLLHVVNRDEVGQLSLPGAEHRCANDSECGQYHECDKSNPDEANLGECIPGKLILGPQGRFACMVDAGGGPFLDPGEYNNVIGAPLWRSDGDMVLVVADTCAATDIDVTNLVAMSPDLSGMEMIVENPYENHGGEACYDDLEMEWTPEGCNIEISRARMSPSGNTIVFIADSVRSSTDTEAWIVDAFGRGSKRDLTRDILTEINDVQVFTP